MRAKVPFHQLGGNPANLGTIALAWLLTQKSAAKIEIAPKTAAMPIIDMALPLTPKPLMPAVSGFVGLNPRRHC